MNSARWKQIEELYFAAAELPQAARDSFLSQKCVDDSDLLAKVKELMRANEENISSKFMEDSPFERGLKILTCASEISLIDRKIGHYRILKLLGSGGMGEVYLAEDERLNRKAALKFLPLYQDQTETVRRFRREARLTSQINHPHVAHVYDIGEADDGRIYISMEYVAGETLRRKLAEKGKLPLAEALKIAAQIAAALSAAHTEGIVHRDIKPENIIVRPDNLIKVLDFGLARLFENENESFLPPSNESQLTTERGMILGTARYMSPEQARGREVNAQTDVWSLGVVIYEMLAGRVPFEGATKSDIIAEILIKEPPDLVKINSQLPKAVRRILAKSLAKELSQRYQTAAEMQTDIERELAKESVAPNRKFLREPKDAANSYSINLKSPVWLFGVAVFLIAVATLATAFYLKRQKVETAENPAQFHLTRLTHSGRAVCAAVSPDAKLIAYCLEEAGAQSLWIREMDSGTSRQIIPSAVENNFEEVGAVFSPDAKFLYFGNYEKNSLQGTLYRVALENGGVPERLLQGIDSPVSFSPDGAQMVYLIVKDELYALIVAKPDGSDGRVIVKRTHPQKISPVAHPSWSPDGKTIAFAAGIAKEKQQYNVVIYDVATGRETILTKEPWFYIKQTGWLADGSAVIMAAAHEGETAEQYYRVAYPSGEMIRLTNDLFDYAITGIARRAENRMIAIAQEDTAQIWKAEIIELGDLNQFAARQLTSGKNESGGVAFAPNGKIVFVSDAGGNQDIWTMNADGGERRQLTDDTAFEATPDVSPDNRFIVFSSNRAGVGNLWRIDFDGGNQTQLTNGNGEYAPQFSPDNRWIVFHRWISGDPINVWKMPYSENGTSAPSQLIDKPSSRPAVSPDSRYVAAFYRESAEMPHIIEIVPLESGAGKEAPRKLKLPKGFRNSIPARWENDGKAIVCVVNKNGADNLWLLPIDGAPPRQITNFTSDRIYNFDLSSDGKQTVLTRGKTSSYVVMFKGLK